MSKGIKKIDIIGNCIHDTECNHFCMVSYRDDTYVTFKLSGFEIVSQYWDYISEKDKPHFQHIYNFYNLHKINVSKKCYHQDTKHACEFIYKNGDKKKYLVDKITLKYYKQFHHVDV